MTQATPSSPPSRLPRPRVVALVVLAMWALLVTFSIARAWHDVQEARDAVVTLRGVKLSEAAGPTFRQKLASTEATFERARRSLAAPWMAPVRLLPVVGRQLSSATSLARGARDALVIAGHAQHELHDASQSSMADATHRVEVVGRLAGIAATAAVDLKAIKLGPSRGLVPALATARAEISEALVEVIDAGQRASLALSGVHGLLEGPRHYLVFASNNAEMRAGAGMFLSVGEVLSADGRLNLGTMRPVTDVPPVPGAPLSPDMAARWGWVDPSKDWRNLMLSPQFPATAQLAAQMWGARGGSPVDGVISIDVIGLRDLLAAVGPVQVDGRRITTSSVTRLLLRDQYAEFAGASGQTGRRDLLAGVATAALGALDNGRWEVVDLVEHLMHAVEGRHVLVWSGDPKAGAAWAAAGVDGAVGPNGVLLAVANRGGNKLDQFLKVTARIETRRQDDETHVDVTVTLRNTAPGDEPRYVAGPYPGLDLEPGEYRGIVALTMPRSAIHAWIDDVPALSVGGDDGESVVVGLQVDIARRASRTLVFHFRLPGAPQSVVIEPSARVPAVRWSFAGRSWSDTTAHDLTL